MGRKRAIERTSVGITQSAVWIHDAAGDRAISSEGLAYRPHLSRDGARIFYLSIPSGRIERRASGSEQSPKSEPRKASRAA